VPSEAQSIVLHDAADIWAVELAIEFKFLLAPIHTIYYFWAMCGEFSFQKRVIGVLSFLQQNRAYQGLLDR
jgi:hypothetical protein